MTISKLLILIFISLTDPAVVFAETNRSAEATYQLIYYDVQSYLSCFRRFNGTHEIGCTTGLNGNVGTLHFINSTESLDWLITNGTHDPYIPLITSQLFTGANIRRLLNSSKVNGLMVSQTDVYDKGTYPENFSSDQKCPNRESDLYKNITEYSCDKHQYNPIGNGLMFEDFKMPIMILRAEHEVNIVIECYNKHNAVMGDNTAPTLPLCSVELKAFMHGAGNTEVCWRRNSMIRNLSPESYCQMLGGKSSYVFIVPKRNPEKHVKTVVITARSDSFSLFEYLQPGTSSPVPGLATLLALAETLNKQKAAIQAAGYNVLILALTGESFDYIGSQRLIYDMQQGNGWKGSDIETPMKLDDVDLVIELSQLIDAVNSSKLFIHTDPITKHNFTVTQQFINILMNSSSDITISEAAADQPLPPSSAQMFIRGRAVPAVVIADYDGAFNAKYYNSYLDNPAINGLYDNPDILNMTYDNVTEQAKFLADVGTAIAKSVMKYITNSSAENNITVSSTTVNHLMYCMLVDQKCEFYRMIVPPDDEGVLDEASSTFPFYTSVYTTDGSHDNARTLILQALAYFTGTEAPDANKDTCDATISFWMNGPVVNGSRSHMCLNSTAHYTNSYSPAFDIADYDFSSGQYSTWTESVWPGNDPFHIKIFLRPSLEVELASVVAGVSVFLISAIVTLIINKRAAILFPPHTSYNVAQTTEG